MDLGATVNNLFQMYRGCQDSYPIITSMAAAEAIFPLAEGIAQLIKDKRIDLRKIGYKAVLAPLYGLGIYGLMQARELVGKYIWSNPIAKGALGPNL